MKPTRKINVDKIPTHYHKRTPKLHIKELKIISFVERYTNDKLI